jgi:hypothetical protein
LHRLLGLLASAVDSGISGCEISEILSTNAGRPCGSAAADGLREKERTDTLSGSHVASLQATLVSAPWVLVTPAGRVLFRSWSRHGHYRAGKLMQTGTNKSRAMMCQNARDIYFFAKLAKLMQTEPICKKRPFTAITRVQIPSGTPNSVNKLAQVSPSIRRCKRDTNRRPSAPFSAPRSCYESRDRRPAIEH